MIRWLAAIAIVCASAPAAALTSAPEYANRQLEDAALEASARDLMHELRCLTCQSQSIADSEAPMAQTMRDEVRSQLAQGRSVDEVRAWMIQRYGDYVTFDPQIGSVTWPLFVLPAIFIALALLLVLRRLGRRGGQSTDTDGASPL